MAVICEISRATTDKVTEGVEQETLGNILLIRCEVFHFGVSRTQMGEVSVLRQVCGLAGGTTSGQQDCRPPPSQ